MKTKRKRYLRSAALVGVVMGMPLVHPTDAERVGRLDKALDEAKDKGLVE